MEPSETPGDLPDLLLISVGNSRTRCAVATAGELEPSLYLNNTELDTLAARLSEMLAQHDDVRPILASVNDPVAARVEELLRQVRVGTRAADAGAQAQGVSLTLPVIRVGRDLPIPLEHALPEPVTAGQDRLLNALGAFSRSQQACIVIDAGTAVTVDFVDGHGVFQGGAIAPGIHMMLRAMHEQTAALPRIELHAEQIPGRTSAGGGTHDRPVEPWGKTTPAAMMLGAVASVRGLAHELIDRYAEFYEAYPRVIATGGDAPLLFDADPLVEHIVPDLTLIGMLAACRIALQAGEGDDDAGRGD